MSHFVLKPVRCDRCGRSVNRMEMQASYRGAQRLTVFCHGESEEMVLAVRDLQDHDFCRQIAAQVGVAFRRAS